MQKNGWFSQFRDRFLTPWWSRYLVVPFVAAAPAAMTAFWFGINSGNPKPFLFKGDQPWIILCVGLWAGLLSALKSWLNEIASFTVSELLRAQQELAQLVGYVRIVVGAKSRRFHESLQALRDPIDAGQAFLTITRPDLQIKEIVKAIHGFFSLRIKLHEERLRVSLMRWNEEKKHLEFCEFFPDSDPPRSRADNFTDATTIAGRAFFEKHVIIADDVLHDERYKRLSDQDGGSLFAYPVIDKQSDRVVLVVNVMSTKPGRFKQSDAEDLKIPMEVFEERLVLENRLVELRQRIERGRA